MKLNHSILLMNIRQRQVQKPVRFCLLTLILSLITVSLSAQIYKPVKWNFSVNKINDTEAELILKAKIDKGWHLYSQFLENDNGPVKTSFNFEKTNDYQTIGKVEESPSIKENDPMFEMVINYFKDKAEFKQKIKISSSKNFKIKGSLEFMVCDNTKCLPPETIDFSFDLEGAKENSDTEKKKVNDTSASEIKVEDTLQKTISENSAVGLDLKSKPAAVIKESEMSFWGIFVAGFIGGLLALLTPCVFPMIPLTVSFFTKQSKNKAKGIANATIYGLSIILIYVGLGFIITKSLGPDALNALASNVWMNLIFFFIFLIFAISFLGAFEITLPSSWINKADSVSERGGLIGIFFMAFTLSLVSFSCTGPIIGTLLVEAAVGGNYLGPLIGMFGFSLALALPFGLFAAFPGWLNSLPKSGGWLNSVKVVLGLLELALSLKFFSNVDLAYHWGILTREIFIALWIIIFAILGFYLLGKIKLSHDSDVPYTSIPRLLMAIITFAFVMYLIPGMFGAPLKLISGFPPPAFYTEGWSIGQNNPSSETKNEMVEGTDPAHCPHNLPCFHDYNLALDYSKKVNKPLMIDFTGWSCVNCRKMEDKVWIDPRVLSRLQNDFVLVSLYVDDKTELPENEKYLSKTTDKNVRTFGNKWSDFQTERFKTNSQPWYVLLDHNEQELNSPTGYDPDIEKYIQFLEEGKTEFEKRKKDK